MHNARSKPERNEVVLVDKREHARRVGFRDREQILEYRLDALAELAVELLENKMRVRLRRRLGLVDVVTRDDVQQACRRVSARARIRSLLLQPTKVRCRTIRHV
jgi:hypothetical protein